MQLFLLLKYFYCNDSIALQSYGDAVFPNLSILIDSMLLKAKYFVQVETMSILSDFISVKQIILPNIMYIMLYYVQHVLSLQ